MFHVNDSFAKAFTTNEVIRFWAKVRRTGSACWPWLAAIGHNDYGVVRIGGRLRKAHRAAWEIQNGQIPAGTLVLHTCDNRLCCNPGHLKLGSQRDNLRDMYEKGRFPVYKSADRSVKLTASRADEIRLLRGEGRKIEELAAQYGVTMSTIHYVLRGDTWQR